MSTSVLINPPKPKGDISHLVGRPLVPFFEEDAENKKYETFAVPAEYKIAARKFVDGYWVNQDGSRAEIGEHTPTLVKKNDTTSKPVSKPTKRDPTSNKENINKSKPGTQSLSPTTNPQPTKSDKKKNKLSTAAASHSSPVAAPSSPSYAAMVSRTMSAPSTAATNNNNTEETFQTPSRSKSTATTTASTSKSDNYAALASPAPVNIPMPKFLGASPPASAPLSANTTTNVPVNPSTNDAQSREEMSAHLMSLLKKTNISSTATVPPSSTSVPSTQSSVPLANGGSSVSGPAAMPYHPYPYPQHQHPYTHYGYTVSSQSSSAVPSLMLMTNNKQSGESAVRNVPVHAANNNGATTNVSPPLPPAAFAAPYPYTNFGYPSYPAAPYPYPTHQPYPHHHGYGAYHHYAPHPMPPTAAVTH